MPLNQETETISNDDNHYTTENPSHITWYASGWVQLDKNN